jgi:epoxyqueuosine reductase
MQQNSALKPNPALTEEVLSNIMEWGADIVGVAPVERFENAPQGYGPLDYMPDAKNVISIGLHLVDGICDVWGEYTEPGKSIGPYLFYGYGLTNLELSRIANRAAKRLEHHGYKGLMFPPTWSVGIYRWTGLKDGSLKADFSHRHAAVAAGLGEFGWNGLVITPSFGSRVRFNSIITNAPLAPSPMYDGPQICQPERCKYLCSRTCPAQALPLDKTKEVDIGGKHFKYSHLDLHRCAYAIAGLIKGSGSFSSLEIPSGPDEFKDIEHELGEQRDPRDTFINGSCRGLICGDYCGRCLHQCPAYIYARTGVKPK